MDDTTNREEQILARVDQLKLAQERLSRDLERARRESRALAIELLFEHGYALSRVATLTGHTRPTLRVWVANEVMKRADDGKTSPSLL